MSYQRVGEGTMLFTAAHELTHFIREWSPEKFKIFSDFLFEKYGERGVSVDELVRNQIEKAKKSGRDISYDTAYEEVVADSCEAMLTDSNAMEKIAELKVRDKSLAQKIKSFICDLVRKIRAVYADLDSDSAEAGFVREMKDAAERLQSLWTEALKDAGESYKAADSNAVSQGSEIKYSDRESLAEVAEKMESIKDEDYLKDKTDNPFVVVMEHTPKIVLDSMKDSNDRKILIRRDALYLAIRENGIQEGHYHDLGYEVLSELPKYLEAPDAILSTVDPITENESSKRRLVLSHIPAKNGQAIISIEFESIKDFDGKKDYYNLVVTVFDLHENYLKRLFKKNGAEIKYKKEDLAQSNPQLYEWLRIINAKSSTNSISQKSDLSTAESENSKNFSSERSRDAVSKRNLLANALESTVRNDQ